ncbi:hypothetical protein KY325_00740 [Candidatus Woesearchaeota archaeon]|nr:hypothetical protein [Candidatus Woesearchaeota archaeon]MBW3017666.1 hypothetical protein [Candidatus Woesearchaeota archaeon]
MTEENPQEPVRLTADDALRLLYKLGYGHRFNSHSAYSDFVSEFPKVYEESGFDFVHAICVVVGRRFPLIRGMRSGKIDYRMDSGIYHRFSADFQARFDRFVKEHKPQLDDKIPIERIIKGLEGKVDLTAGSQEEEEDPDADSDAGLDEGY